MFLLTRLGLLTVVAGGAPVVIEAQAPRNASAVQPTTVATGAADPNGAGHRESHVANMEDHHLAAKPVQTEGSPSTAGAETAVLLEVTAGAETAVVPEATDVQPPVDMSETAVVPEATDVQPPVDMSETAAEEIPMISSFLEMTAMTDQAKAEPASLLGLHSDDTASPARQPVRRTGSHHPSLSHAHPAGKHATGSDGPHKMKAGTDTHSGKHAIDTVEGKADGPHKMTEYQKHLDTIGRTTHVDDPVQKRGGKTTHVDAPLQNHGISEFAKNLAHDVLAKAPGTAAKSVHAAAPKKTGALHLSPTKKVVPEEQAHKKVQAVAPTKGGALHHSSGGLKTSLSKKVVPAAQAHKVSAKVRPAGPTKLYKEERAYQDAKAKHEASEKHVLFGFPLSRAAAAKSKQSVTAVPASIAAKVKPSGMALPAGSSPHALKPEQKPAPPAVPMDKVKPHRQTDPLNWVRTHTNVGPGIELVMDYTVLVVLVGVGVALYLVLQENMQLKMEAWKRLQEFKQLQGKVGDQQ